MNHEGQLRAAMNALQVLLDSPVLTDTEKTPLRVLRAQVKREWQRGRRVVHVDRLPRLGVVSP